MKSNIIILSLVLLGGYISLHGQSIQSAIVEADGYAYLSEDKTIREIRNEALVNAKRNALEKAQTHIQSYTKSENFILIGDLIVSSAEGDVKIIDSKDNGIDEQNRYHYWIEAEISYDLESKQDLLKEDYKPLTIEVWSNKNNYVENDNLIFFLKGNKDFYANILYEDAIGNVVQIMPNQYDKNNYFLSNKTYTIPSVNDPFKLTISEPFGIEKINIYASTNQLGDVQVAPVDKNFYKITETQQAYAQQTRGIKVESSKPAEFFETSISIDTKKYKDL